MKFLLSDSALLSVLHESYSNATMRQFAELENTKRVQTYKMSLESLSAMPADWWVPRIIGFMVITLILVSIRRRREGILHRLRRVIIVEATYIGVVYVLSQLGRTGLESLLGGIAAALIVNQMMPGRSRHIPASVRRRKVAEYELQTGKKFNPRKHELDHEIAFSKGGSHTDDNLRVVEKRKNRSKGAKSPWWDLLGR
jgi:hypothetical protein